MSVPRQILAAIKTDFSVKTKARMDGSVSEWDQTSNYMETCSKEHDHFQRSV